MKRIFLVLMLSLALFSAGTPNALAAANFFGPIIPDGTNGQPDCTCEEQVSTSGVSVPSAPDWGCVMQTLQNLINLAISLSFIIAILFIVYTGFMFVSSAGSPGQREAAKTRLMNVVIGILVVLSAWLIVDFIMKTLYNSDDPRFGPWNQILASQGDDLCFNPAERPGALPGVTAEPDSGSGTGTGSGSHLTGTSGCPNCVSLSERGLTCKESNSCTADPRVASRLVEVKNDFEGTWRVTEAYPPTVRHSNRCHQMGTCVDAGFTGNTSYSATNVLAFARAARAAGFRAVFETSSCTLRNSVREQGVEAFCSSDNGYGHITGNHFSLYATN